ncbi:hypothetical protein PBI_SMARTIES_65 [Microbacterium phage Smarties]|uniref:Uncharacterized protein n=1 Tax=Microbacterium phage Ariadne TaxID=2656546 RepID=A0A649VBH1_9CAUD|nr:hypothetical protein QDA10_gp065 [Microbacterium phage Ariadne]QGJ89469.1 hypothetical protein PBI_ARIADNE_65 [Microbacterium phage Ariadne]QGJ91456.1 hypothetical protein PBI_SMARTIES_65 [Microbacterium phage Smarties]
MRHSELSRLMSEAARRATEVCMAKGYTRGDPVTLKSARAAAEEVYRRECPEDWAAKPVEHAPVEDAWQERADVGG